MRDVETLDERFERPADLDPVAMLEQHLAVGWEFSVEVVVDAPIENVRRYLSPALGRLEAVDEHTRLVGSTGNPYWYAEQLAIIPRPVPRRRRSGASAHCRRALAGGLDASPQ